jgi:methylenetetrahydrofolate reductase (NADPH)
MKLNIGKCPTVQFKTHLEKTTGTVAIAASIQHRYNIPVVPHILCGGFTKSETEHVLIDLYFLEIENVLALRGDGVKNQHVFQPEKKDIPTPGNW